MGWRYARAAALFTEESWSCEFRSLLFSRALGIGYATLTNLGLDAACARRQATARRAHVSRKFARHSVSD